MSEHQLVPDYSLADVAQATGMSERWLRQQVKDGAEHLRYGHKIRFTTAQVDKLREARTVSKPKGRAITSGRKRGA